MLKIIQTFDLNQKIPNAQSETDSIKNVLVDKAIFIILCFETMNNSYQNWLK